MFSLTRFEVRKTQANANMFVLQTIPQDELDDIESMYLSRSDILELITQLQKVVA